MAKKKSNWLSELGKLLTGSSSSNNSSSAKSTAQKQTTKSTNSRVMDTAPVRNTKKTTSKASTTKNSAKSTLKKQTTTSKNSRVMDTAPLSTTKKTTTSKSNAKSTTKSNVQRNKTVSQSTNSRVMDTAVTANNKSTTAKSLSPKTSDKSRTTVSSILQKANNSKAMDIAPTVQGEMTDERKWFQKPKAFEDGYQRGDITKAIVGTATDVTENVAAAILGVGETSLDSAVMLSPLAQGYNAIRLGGTPNYELYERNKTEAEKFVAGDLYDEQAIAKNIITKPVQRMGIDVENESVFGEKSDSLVQSMGRMGATMALQGAGVPWWLTTGATSFGSEAENALNQGATYEQAGGSAMISAGAEILSEKLSGGISFGGKTLDDALIDPLVKRISNKAVRTLTKLGFDAAGEGAEEVVSSVFSRLGTSLYEEESIKELLTSEDAMDEYIESFIGGAVMGSASNAISALQANVSGVDSATGLRDNELKVLQNEVEKRIAEAEETEGKKLSIKKKNDITEQVYKDMTKGYIDIDTIESVLGGDTYQNYKSVLDQEESLKKAYEEAGSKTEDGLDYIARDEQRKAYEDAKNKYEEFQKTSNKEQLRQQLSDEVGKTIENDMLLRESYNERSRRGQKFEADLSKYDAKQREVVKRAIESGILNNTNRTRDFVNMVAKISADTGVSFDFTNNEKLKESGFAVGRKIINGYVKDNNIAVNINSNKALNTVVGHEITYVLERTELYTELQKAVKEYATTKGEYQALYDSMKVLYKDVDSAVLDNEVTAELVGKYLFTDTDFVNRLSAEQPNVFKKIYDEIEYLAKIATAGSAEARQLEQAKRIFEKVYKETAKKNFANANADTKYSLEKTSDGTEYVKAEKNLFVKKDGTMLSEREIFSSLVGKTIDLPEGEIKIINRLPGKDMYNELSKRRPRYEGVEDVKKLNSDVNHNMEELLTNSEAKVLNEPDVNNRHQKQGISSFDTRTVKFYDGDNAYDIEFSIATLNSGEKVAYAKKFFGHDENLTKKIQASEARSKSPLNQNPVTNNIPQNSENASKMSDVKYSLTTDTENRTLSKEQQTYFKDSKIRDENGNLKVMYHGSQESFTVFDKRKAKSSGLYGRGFYFTDSASHAGQYGNQLEVYLNITNPIQNGTNNITKDQLRNFVEELAENEDYGIENYGYGATVDSITDDIYGKDDFAMLMDLNVTCVGNMVEAIELFNKVNGTDYNGIVAATETVAFYPNQIKKVDDQSPTSDADIRFSLSESVEETKDLIAVHNLRGAELIKTLELGGLPMPSIAVIKAQDGHEMYGDVTLILPKESIDPKANKANKVYGGDAWTPTYPKIEYKPNAKVEKKISDKYYDFANRYGYDEAKPLYRYVHELEDALNREGGEEALLERLYDDTNLMQVFLQDTGKEKVQDVVKETVTKISEAEAEMNQYMLDTLGRELIVGFKAPVGKTPAESIAYRRAYMEEHEAEIRNVYAKLCEEVYGFTTEEVENVLDNTDRKTLMKIMRDVYMYSQNNGVTVKTETDYEATREAIRNSSKDGYKEWVDSLFKGVEEKTGIRNNAEVFTNGNKRSWDALHWENTLENVVKVMKQQDNGQGFFGGVGIWGVSAKEYGSIEEIKSDSSRLRKMSDDEYEKLKESYQNRLSDIASKIMSKTERNQFIAIDNAMECIVDSVRVSKNTKGIFKELKQYRQLNVTEKDANDIVSLVNDIANMPTGYFEAKPQRAVGLDEVGVFVIPDNSDAKLKHELLNKGYSIAEYNPNLEGDRKRVVNQFENLKFSLSENDNNGTSDYSFDAPIRAGYAPMTEGEIDKLASRRNVAEQTLSDTESVFVSNGMVTMRNGEEVTIEDYKTIRTKAIAEYEEANLDYENAVEQMPAHNEFAPMTEAEANERDAMLQRDRLGTLTVNDMPPEVAPYYGETEIKDVSPFDDRDIQDVGDRKVKAYMYENPEVKPYFQDEAQIMLSELRNSIKGEKTYNDQLYYESNGEQGWFGTKRQTSEEIAYLLDNFKYTYADIEKGLKAIIEDHGAENNAISKRIEFMLDERLREGYTDFVSGYDVPNNPDYIALLDNKQITEYNDEAYNRWLSSLANKTSDKKQTIDAPIKGNNNKLPTFAEGAKEDSSDIAPVVKGESEEQKIARALAEEPKTDKQKDNRLWAIFKANVFDKGAVFEDLSLKTKNRELMGKWNYTLYSEGRAQSLIGDGDVENNVKALNTIQEEVGNAGITETLYDYLYHKHNVDRMTLSDRFSDGENKAVFGDSVTAEMSQKVVDQYEATQPELMAYAEDIYSYNRYLRKLLVDGGVISQETADKWEKMYPHYVPIRRVDSKGLNINVPLDTKRTGINAPVKRATGGNSDILPLFNTMAMRTMQTYKAIAKNSFGVELKNTLGNATYHSAVSVNEVIESIDAQENLLQDGTKDSYPTFTVFENGEKVTFEITQDMYDALKPISDSSLLSKTIKPLNVASNLHRNVLTEYNPVFLLTNAIKDAQDVLINSQHPVKTYAKIAEAHMQVIKKGYWYKEYMQNGGEQNTYFDNQTNTFKVEEESTAKKVATLPLKGISAANNYIEMIPRLAEYIASREEGRSIEVSMLDSARVTTNFMAGGDLTKFLNRNGGTFLNASVQGAMQQVRNVREANANGLKGWVNLATKFIVAGVPAFVLNAIVWDDDDEYEDLSDYVKQNYYIVGKYGDGQFIRIPKGRTVAVIQEGIRQISNLATGNDEADLKSYLEFVISNLAPNNPIENNVIAPILQVMNNETWYGGDLVPSRLQDVPAEEQYDESTDSFSRTVGEIFGVSPIKINYLLDQYSGGIGDVILPMLTPEAESGDDSLLGNILAPLKSKFTTDSVMNNQDISDFYDLKDELTVNANSINATEDDVLKNKYMSSVNSEIAELYQKKREIQSNNAMSDSAKYAQVKALQEQINALAEDAINSYDDVKVYGTYAVVGDKQFRQNDENEWRAISAEQIVKQQRASNLLGISAKEYWSNDDNREAYDWAVNYPDYYQIARTISDDILVYWEHNGYIWNNIRADKDANGNSIAGTKKTKVIDYINNTDLEYEQKIMLFKKYYPADDTYNNEIIDYLNSRDDISYEQMETILEQLDFEVDEDGNITW